MCSYSKMLRAGLAIALALSPMTSHAYTISIGSPSAGSLWQAGADLACAGSMEWINNPPIKVEMRPTTGIVYIHAGGNGGFVTNSKAMNISNIGASSEDWDVTLELKPSVPPLYGGGGAAGAYTVQADGLVSGASVVSKFVQISVSNG
jgi:hypothetical protein